MDWRHIPSLAALRAFEAASRHSSLTAAAAALNVTQAAVSQHIRTLESDLGCTLMIRQGRKMDLTAEGKQLAATLTQGFSTIATGVADLRGQLGGKPVTVSLTPSFAENWLMPRLGSFWAAHPDIDLSIQPSHRLVDLAVDGIDVAIRYGRGPFPDHSADMLTSATLCAVCAPQVAAQQRSATWFFETYRTEYRVWAHSHGLITDATPTTAMDTNTLALSAARAGLGICVQLKDVVARDLDAGTLVSIFETDETTLGYHVLTRPHPPSKQLATFLKWLHAAA
ncbi:LysR family transcriptional regulator [Nereida sp. MMG025]|uniref:LysR family transcriptional regulator n=1 Tax=Nereida sp. MMG025 TaxID=2909981 RepID=UPI001F269126|nr:LysR family transcriptional regulator [Nereida sp. MMG025]MCF6444885.1 LysR family transcriptional regulator [Nereida sp. MMG025]